MATAGHIAEARTARATAKKKLHHLEVHPAKNGGHTVHHHYHSPDGSMGWHEPDVFAFGSGPETVSHLMDHLGVKENEMLAHMKGTTSANEPEPEEYGEREAPANPKHRGRSQAEEKGED